MTPLPSRNRRFVAAGIHLLVSAGIATVAALVVFLIWYPPPLDVLAGGTQLFILLMSVDVVAGPALTFVVASPGKPGAELRRDLVVIGLFQLGALGYGMYTVSQVRPVVVAFEVDRLRVVSAVDIDPATLHDAPEGLRSLPWTGPRQIAAIKPTDPNQQLRSIDLGLAGVDLSMDPRNWRPYDSQRDAVWRAAKPLAKLLERFPSSTEPAQRLARKAGQPIAALRYLPLQSRRLVWTAILAGPEARVVGYLPVDPF